jgi:prevent-host-death family protein
MTKSVNVHEAKTHLSRLLDEAMNGDEIIIARSGVPLVRLVPIDQALRPEGFVRGIWPDLELDAPFFDALPDSELNAWEG